TMRQRLHDRRCVVLAAVVRKPCGRENRVLQRVPGDEEEARGAQGEPGCDGFVLGAHGLARIMPSAGVTSACGVDLFFPTLEQALALRRSAIFRAVVVDELEIGEWRHLRWERHVLVSRDRVFLEVQADSL